MWGMERGTPEEGGIGPGVDAVVDAVEVLCGGWREERQRKVASVREWMQSWMLLRFCVGDGERNARGRWHRSGSGCSRGCC